MKMALRRKRRVSLYLVLLVLLCVLCSITLLSSFPYFLTSRVALQGATWTQPTPLSSGLYQDYEDHQAAYNPKVALLFLTCGLINTEPIWVEFFKAAAEVSLAAKPTNQYVGFKSDNLSGYLKKELFPTESVDWNEEKRKCWEHGGEEVGYLNPKSMQPRHRSPYRPGNNLPGFSINQQELFTVYVHTKPDFEGFPLGSIFRNHEIQHRVLTEFGAHSIIEAERALLQTALQNPFNVKFVLLSDSCIPLYHPAMLYAQLMSESQSRVDACTFGKEPHRWSSLMQTNHFTNETFRKSSQWWTLTRPHAQLIVADQHVHPKMKSYCVFKQICGNKRKAHVCISDEMYVPSVLATYGLDDETDCLGSVTAANWTNQDWHPKEFKKREITTSLFRRLRTEDCEQQYLDSQVSNLFRIKGDAHDYEEQEWSTFKAMETNCSLFARKFPDQPALYQMMTIVHDCMGLQQSSNCL